MTLDPKIIEAVQSATAQEGQDKALADKILAWMNAVTSGNEEINDEQSALRHLEMLYDSVKTTQTGRGVGTRIVPIHGDKTLPFDIRGER